MASRLFDRPVQSHAAITHSPSVWPYVPHTHSHPIKIAMPRAQAAPVARLSCRRAPSPRSHGHLPAPPAILICHALRAASSFPAANPAAHIADASRLSHTRKAFPGGRHGPSPPLRSISPILARSRLRTLPGPLARPRGPICTRIRPSCPRDACAHGQLLRCASSRCPTGHAPSPPPRKKAGAMAHRHSPGHIIRFRRPPCRPPPDPPVSPPS